MEVERTLAGILLNKPEVIAEVVNLVSKNDFLDSRAGKVFELAKEHFIQSKPFDLVIAAGLMPGEELYLAEIHDVIPVNYKTYAAQINNFARKRRLITGLKIIEQSALSADEMLQDISTLHKQELQKNLKGYSISEVIVRVDGHIAENRRRGIMPGISTGFQFLDDKYVRYAPGHIWVMTGFTSVGKSKMLVEKIKRIPQAKVVLISTEMTETQLMSRFYARETGINENAILSGMLNGRAKDAVATARGHYLARDLKIIDDVVELVDIEALVQQESMRGGVDVVFIDYVQNCNIKGIPRREQGMEMASRLQQLAKKTNTCLVCLSQVSNSVGRGDIEQFEAKGAGEWAAVADVGVRLKRLSSDKQALLYDMQKGRHYQTVSEELRFSSNFTRIDEVETRGAYG